MATNQIEIYDAMMNAMDLNPKKPKFLTEEQLLSGVNLRRKELAEFDEAKNNPKCVGSKCENRENLIHIGDKINCYGRLKLWICPECKRKEDESNAEWEIKVANEKAERANKNAILKAKKKAKEEKVKEEKARPMRDEDILNADGEKMTTNEELLGEISEIEMGDINRLIEAIDAQQKRGVKPRVSIWVTKTETSNSGKFYRPYVTDLKPTDKCIQP